MTISADKAVDSAEVMDKIDETNTEQFRDRTDARVGFLIEKRNYIQRI